MDIPARPSRMRPSQIVYDASFQASNETALGRNVAAYVLRCCGSAAQYQYGNLGTAPYATITAVNTWYDFSWYGNSSGRADFAWFHQKQFSSIRGMITVVSSCNAVFKVRLQSDDLVDSVATSNSKGHSCVPAQPSSFLEWRNTFWHRYAQKQYDGGKWRSGSVRVRLESPTLPSNRRIAIAPQVSIDGVSSLALAAAGSPRVYLEALILHDVVDEDTQA